MLSPIEIAIIGAELIGARRLEDCRAAVVRLLPRVAPCDRLEYRFVDLDQETCPHRPDNDAVDALTVVLWIERVRRRCLVLVLRRAGPRPGFSAEEIAAVGLLGPMLSAAFVRAIELEGERQRHRVNREILAGAGKFTLLVARDRALAALDARTRAVLAQIFGAPPHGPGVPRDLERIAVEMIGTLEADPDARVLSRDVPCLAGPCRLHLSRADHAVDGAPVYQVLIDRNPENFSLGLLADAGLTEIQVRIVELLQLGARSATIAAALGVSRGDVKYHLKRIGEKIYASGKTEIVGRALALHQELVIRRGLSEAPRAGGERQARLRPSFPRAQGGRRSLDELRQSPGHLACAARRPGA